MRFTLQKGCKLNIFKKRVIYPLFIFKWLSVTDSCIILSGIYNQHWMVTLASFRSGPLGQSHTDWISSNPYTEVNATCHLVQTVLIQVIYLTKTINMAAEAAAPKYDPGWRAPPFDARFPHQNQWKNCLQNYIDYHRCLKIKGEDYVDCNYFRSVYKHVCTSSMVEKWDEQVEAGVFQYKF